MPQLPLFRAAPRPAAAQPSFVPFSCVSSFFFPRALLSLPLPSCVFLLCLSFSLTLYLLFFIAPRRSHCATAQFVHTGDNCDPLEKSPPLERRAPYPLLQFVSSVFILSFSPCIRRPVPSYSVFFVVLTYTSQFSFFLFFFFLSAAAPDRAATGERKLAVSLGRGARAVVR